ncbi:uncharacterized protein LOC123537537 [Mercenaria mercenaria]|uniref:uncharacterized protein LOC123537537 n=1 Tax=Mercenaria mercenaria TaxID=6596 RepID=UPI00234E3AD0|nr:uncharacterized protein LOC123537537 [Mercenaria mercenaria]
MCGQFHAPSCFSGLMLAFLLHIGIINSVELYKSKYILPVLPSTQYTLHDVIILPENTDVVEASIISRPSSTVLATLTLTLGHGFRLGNAYTLHNSSLESGLQIMTLSKTTLVIELTTGLLKVQSIDLSGQSYYMSTFKDYADTNYDIQLLIQSTVTDTTINLCNAYNKADETAISNETQFSQEIPKMVNCTTKKLFLFERLLLNKVSKVQGIEITSDHPISILQGYETRSSSLFRNGEDFNTLEPEKNDSPINWHIIKPISDWSNQFVLIPSEDRREFKLLLMSLVNTSVSIQTDEDIIRLALTAKTPANISISNEPGHTLIVTGKDQFSMSCVKSDETSCRNELLPFNVDNMASNTNDSNRKGTKSDEYQWVYITDDTKILIFCPLYIWISLYTSNGTIESTEEIHFNISSIYIKITTFTNFSYGLYKISFNDTMNKCDIFYTYKYSSRGNSTTNLYDINYTTIPFSSFSKVSEKSLTVSENFVTSDTTSRKAEDEMGDNLSVKLVVSTDKNTTADDNRKWNKSASLLSHDDIAAPADEKSTKSTVSHKITKQNNEVIDTTNKKSNKVTVDVNNGNRRFKAVVDILHSNEGRRDKLISSSAKQNNPTYTYTFDINENFVQEGDGKSPVAIIASLVAAILAVGAIILIFLLKEFILRRQQIRKTRIRPFISYY